MPAVPVARGARAASGPGAHVPDDVLIRVHDSNANMRYPVMPMRPGGTEGRPEHRLAELVTRDSMIGVTAARSP